MKPAVQTHQATSLQVLSRIHPGLIGPPQNQPVMPWRRGPLGVAHERDLEDERSSQLGLPQGFAHLDLGRHSDETTHRDDPLDQPPTLGTGDHFTTGNTLH